MNVEGSSLCPHPGAVAERLRPLVSEELRAASAGTQASGTSASAAMRARVDTTPDGLSVRLSAPDGAVVGQRILPGHHGCPELAQAAAVMIASWMGSSPPAPLAAPPLPRTEAVRAAASPPTGLRWQLDASLGGALAGGGSGVAPAARVSGALILGGPLQLGARFDAIGTGWADTALGDRGARWRRSSLVLGPRAGLRSSWFSAEMHAGAAATFLQVEGRGFTTEETRRSSELLAGILGGLRLSMARWRWQPFLEAGLGFWPARSEVYALPDGRSAELPRRQLLLTLGVSYAPP